MPSKGKRVATRQNNLRRRRSGASRTTAARNPAAAATVATSVAEAEPDRPAAAVTATVGAPADTAIGRPASAPRGRRFDRPAAYNYVGSELTRIGIFSGVLLAVLITVSFVL